MARRFTRGFTLVELLVVVSIIVVLLSLLAPALDQAIYQAELVRCATQMKAAAGGQLLYAMDNKRYYMYRHNADASPYTFSHTLKGAKAFIAANTDIDDRPIHAGYIDLDWLMDPLAQYVDPKLNDGELENPQETVYAGYALQYGWAYTRGVGRDALGQTRYGDYQGMRKMGDRWEARDDKRGGAVHAFPWLLTDTDLPSEAGAGGVTATHPDKNGVLVNRFAQAGNYDYGDSTMNAGLNPGLPVTYSWWMKYPGFEHGKMDLNFAADDGGVHRLNDVANKMDDRIAHVPHQRLSGSFSIWLNIARQ